MTNNCFDKLTALIVSGKVNVEKQFGCDEAREHIERVGNQHFSVESGLLERDEAFLLVFSLLPPSETNHDYNTTRTLILELVTKDAVQLVHEDSVLEPHLCVAHKLRDEYRSLYEKEKAKIQQSWNDYETARAKIVELKLSTNVELKEPEQKEPELPFYCYNSIYAIDYSTVRWSIYADRATDIWRALMLQGIVSDE